MTMRHLTILLAGILFSGDVWAATVTQIRTGAHGRSQDTRVAANVQNQNTDGVVSAERDRFIADRSGDSMSFNLFNADLGTLTSIDFTYEVTSRGTNRLSELRGSCETSTGAGCFQPSRDASAQVGYGIKIDPLRINNDSLDVGVFSNRPSTDSGPGLIVPDKTTVAFGLPEAQDTLRLTGAVLSDFIGPGAFFVRPLFTVDTTVGVRCDAIVPLDNLTECSFDSRVTYNANFAVTVQYNFDEAVVGTVPLPSAFPLLIVGIGGLGLAVWRRRT